MRDDVEILYTFDLNLLSGPWKLRITGN
jgi:hypothetical protein